MSMFKCKMCGGTLEIENNQAVATCEYCGTQQTVPTSVDENLQSVYNRANTLRIKSEFDKAEKLYEKILQIDSKQSEAYWGLILCKYGIEYVDDPATLKKIPTCHRASFESVIADDDYKSALEHADTTQRAVYEEQAKEIDRIQKEILALAQKEESYDVFICYKETDSNGQRTQDSVIANDIYYQLTERGFKVFYAAITLEGKLGSAYEPIIFAALNSAKVMLAIGTNPEHFNAVWVKNEWSRYLKIIAKDRSKLLIPCYRDMDAYELPEEFAHLQAQNMSKIGFINDVVRGIEKVISKPEQKETVIQEPIVTTVNTNIAPLVERIFMFLEDSEWENANDYCEKVLDIDPKCAQAYLGKLMAELRVNDQESLKNQKEPFDNRNNYKKVMRFADDELKKVLAGYIEYINFTNEQEHLESAYNYAKQFMDNADFEEAAHLFESIGNYKNSSALVQLCNEKAEEVRKDDIYNKAKKEFERACNITSGILFESAKKLFQSIPSWKDTDDLILVCDKKIEEINAKIEADRLERERQAEIEQEEIERKYKRNKKIYIITVSTLLVVTAFIITLYTVIIPAIKYNNAVDLMDKEEYLKAYEILITLDDYKDSEEKANSIYKEYKSEKLKAAKVGDYVFFGSYEQDNTPLNGKEDIEWLILDIVENQVLVISKYVLDCNQYNSSYTDVTWETCSLREWLNNDFMNTAFTADEKTMIPTVTVSADENPGFNRSSGNATEDKVFLLSAAEATKYFTTYSTRRCKPTDSVVANTAFVNSSNGNCWWWLRTSGRDWLRAAYISSSGLLNASGVNIDIDGGPVRPAMWIDLNV